MTALKILGVILLIFLLIGFIRVGAVVSFGEALCVRLRIGPLKLTILPKKKKAKKKKKEKPKQEEQVEEEEKPKKKRKLPKLSLGEIVDLIETALTALGVVIRRVCKRLRIDPLDVTVRLGGYDPAAIAQTFAYASAALYALMPKAEELFYIPDPSLHLRMDFDEPSTTADGSVGLSLRICDLFAILFTLAVPLLKWFIRYKKAHKGEKPDHRGAAAQENEAEHNTDQAEELIA